MGLIRFLFIFFLVYLVFKFVKALFRFKFRSSQTGREAEEFKTSNDKEKIISKDEGEYVDFEEMD